MASSTAERVDFSALEAALGHRFVRPDLLSESLTHPSLAGLTRTPAGRAAPGSVYERLEFLGDRVLGLLMAEWLLECYPHEREGQIARRHTSLVRRETLAGVALSLGLDQWLRLSPGEKESGARGRTTLYADACEAVIGALYLDGGLDAVRPFVRRYWDGAIGTSGGLDAKTELQEWAQSQGKPLPVYRIIDRQGPDHAPEFQVEVAVIGLPAAHGRGASRRAAEVAAARSLLAQAGVSLHDS